MNNNQLADLTDSVNRMLQPKPLSILPSTVHHKDLPQAGAPSSLRRQTTLALTRRFELQHQQGFVLR